MTSYLLLSTMSIAERRFPPEMVKRVVHYLCPFSDRASLYAFAMASRDFKEHAYDKLHSHFYCVFTREREVYTDPHGICFFLEHAEHICRIRHVKLWPPDLYCNERCPFTHTHRKQNSAIPWELMTFILNQIDKLFSLQLLGSSRATYPEQLRQYIANANPRYLYIQSLLEDIGTIPASLFSFRDVRTIILSFDSIEDDSAPHLSIPSEESVAWEKDTAQPLTLSLAGQAGYHLIKSSATLATTRDNKFMRRWMSHVSSQLLRLSLDLSRWSCERADGKLQ